MTQKGYLSGYQTQVANVVGTQSDGEGVKEGGPSLSWMEKQIPVVWKQNFHVHSCSPLAKGS